MKAPGDLAFDDALKLSHERGCIEWFGKICLVNALNGLVSDLCCVISSASDTRNIRHGTIRLQMFEQSPTIAT